MTAIANTPNPPYIAAIFTAKRSEVVEGYDKMNELTFREVESIDGFLGYEAFHDENGFGVNISYWRDLNSLQRWKDNPLHQVAQKRGKDAWYSHYRIRICRVERDYEFKT